MLQGAENLIKDATIRVPLTFCVAFTFAGLRLADSFGQVTPPASMVPEQKAAEAGDADGMYKLGRMYELGRGGLLKDDAEAVSWYQKAAEAGSAKEPVVLKV